MPRSCQYRISGLVLYCSQPPTRPSLAQTKPKTRKKKKKSHTPTAGWLAGWLVPIIAAAAPLIEPGGKNTNGHFSLFSFPWPTFFRLLSFSLLSRHIHL